MSDAEQRNAILAMYHTNCLWNRTRDRFWSDSHIILSLWDYKKKYATDGKLREYAFAFA